MASYELDIALFLYKPQIVSYMNLIVKKYNSMYIQYYLLSLFRMKAQFLYNRSYSKVSL